MTEVKRCMTCKAEKPVSDFPQYAYTYNRCRACKRAQRNASYRRNREREIAKQKARFKAKYYADLEASRKYWREQKRRWVAKNPGAWRADMEAVRRRSREWRRKFRIEHPEEARARDRRFSFDKNAKRRGAIGAKRVDRKKIRARDGMRCHICRRKVSEKDLHFDHVIPISKGGEHCEENVVVTHKACNLKKAAKVLTLF